MIPAGADPLQWERTAFVMLMILFAFCVVTVAISVLRERRRARQQRQRVYGICMCDYCQHLRGK